MKRIIPAAALAASAALMLPLIASTPALADIPDDPYHVQNGSMYHYVRESGTTFDSIASNIASHWYTDRGIHDIHIYAPYQASSDWRGVPAIDYFATNSSTGTVADFADMTEAAHDEGMTVSMYISLVFVHTSNALWTTAQTQKGAGMTTDTTRLFRWSSTGTGSTPPEGDWAYSSTAHAYYATAWGFPALDYNQLATRNYAKSVLNFWLDQGVDGFEFDAPETYWGMTTAYETDIMITTPQTHSPVGPKLLTAEGSAGGYANEAWSDSVGFTNILFNGDADDESFATRIMDGTGTADQLDTQLADYVDGRNAAGGGASAWSLYDTSLSGSRRALDAAVQAGNGVLYSIEYDTQYSLLSSGDQAKYDAVFTTLASSPALAPGASRTRLSTGSDAKFYSTLRTSQDGTSSAIGVFNFKSSSASITVNLTGSGVTVPQTPTNLATGLAATAISSSSYTVTVPAYGYLFLDVATGGGGGPSWTTVDDAASGWTYGGGWTSYAEPAGHAGTAHGGDTLGGYGSYTFTGTEVEVDGWHGPDGGVVDILVDGVSHGTQNLHAGSDTFGVVATVTGLSPGSHTVRVQQTSSSGSAWTMVDFIRYR